MGWDSGYEALQASSLQPGFLGQAVLARGPDGQVVWHAPQPPQPPQYQAVPFQAHGQHHQHLSVPGQQPLSSHALQAIGSAQVPQATLPPPTPSFAGS